ncbi:1-aminocyclopropane-1-carboxylate deaminase/D-cysteine desulfhydrase [Segetibacter aerophilus]|uniref:1-aminocyclopropane-1-carboxylate deaminase/D-cysteine desulfhydrase n=1 Tax=Segetibacter aerophilus TaxID=670293 RepID=UPI001479340F|nr:pyridoxal-phosphate dependent enzyme [Segetibacter aerophilus]
MDLSSIDVQRIEAEWLIDNDVSLDVVRLDKMDAVVSGNKWFKLKYYLLEAQKQQKTVIATFGGAWSNHIIATAFAAKQAGLKSVGIIRGEKPGVLSYTLIKAIEFDMELHYVSRDQYQRKQEIVTSFLNENWFWVDEGGYGKTGAKGASEILKTVRVSAYTHIVAAVGTGTMLAGLVMGSTKNESIIGISSMKGNYSIEEKIRDLLEQENGEALFEIKHDYHFGGYGKHPEELIAYINDVYYKHSLPLDIVYTGKTFYAIEDLVKKKYFEAGSKVLMIHSGGLQGNESLGAKVLAF